MTEVKKNIGYDIITLGLKPYFPSSAHKSGTCTNIDLIFYSMLCLYPLCRYFHIAADDVAMSCYCNILHVYISKRRKLKTQCHTKFN